MPYDGQQSVIVEASLAQGSLRYADAIYVAAAERHEAALRTADARIERSGAPITCEVITVVPAPEPEATVEGHAQPT